MTVLEHQQQQLDLPEALDVDSPSRTKSHPAIGRSPPASQADRRVGPAFLPHINLSLILRVPPCRVPGRNQTVLEFLNNLLGLGPDLSWSWSSFKENKNQKDTVFA